MPSKSVAAQAVGTVDNLAPTLPPARHALGGRVVQGAVGEEDGPTRARQNTTWKGPASSSIATSVSIDPRATTAGLLSTRPTAPAHASLNSSTPVSHFR
jgi:hypothetical protein